MWNDFLNESRSQQKFSNTPLIILGNKHSGKRSLVDSLFDISKTTIHNKRLAAQIDANKMRLKGLTTAIDYAYLNVLDLTDVDYRTHTKLQVYMIQQPDNPQIYNQLADKQLLKKAVIVIMLDFTNPWNFMAELNRWINFIYQLQKRAEFTSSDLDLMAKRIEDIYKKFKEPEFDENGKLKKVFDYETGEQEIDIPLPQGVLQKNMRIPLIVCVNKCDLQSQVFRDQSNYKIMFVMYHLRKFCAKYGASLIYTSIKNNSNLNLIYEYTLHLAYTFPFRFKSEDKNQEAIFIPIGYDNMNLIEDSVVKMDVTKSYDEVIAVPQAKRAQREEIVVEEESKYFEKYINNQASTVSNAVSESTSVGNSSSMNKSVTEQGKKTSDATNFFKNLLTAGSRRETTKVGETRPSEIRVSEAEKYLQKHTREVMKKKE